MENVVQYLFWHGGSKFSKLIGDRMKIKFPHPHLVPQPSTVSRPQHRVVLHSHSNNRQAKKNKYGVSFPPTSLETLFVVSWGLETFLQILFFETPEAWAVWGKDRHSIGLAGTC